MCGMMRAQGIAAEPTLATLSFYAGALFFGPFFVRLIARPPAPQQAS